MTVHTTPTAIPERVTIRFTHDERAHISKRYARAVARGAKPKPSTWIKSILFAGCSIAGKLFRAR